MDLPLAMDKSQLFKTKLNVESFNKSLGQNGRQAKNILGKEDFLKLLIVQLEHQDPTNPLDDKEFIAQTAQFSSLEQMTEMNKTLSTLIDSSKTNLSYSLLGRRVEVLDEATGKMESGIVTDVQFNGGAPSITFNGITYGIDAVKKVSLAEAAASSK
jgi:flagellar basal-body rod modification protein FlgD